MAWIDYQRAFDSLLHTWIFTVMEIHSICPNIRRFVEALMKEWKNEMWLYDTKGHAKTGKVAIKWGIFQGDYFSPLLFSTYTTNQHAQSTRSRV